MKPNHQHELQFLRYLDALDNADANAIADFLAQAEHDPQLTQMLLDYHAQEETVNLNKIIPYPLRGATKHKRKNSDRFINPLVASILLVLIGFLAGFGLTRLQGNNPMAAVIPPTAPITGFGYGGHVETLDAAAIEAMQTANMTWVKYHIQYQQGDSADAIRSQIDIAHANGFRVMLQVVGVPGEINNDNYFDSYGRFVGELAGYGADAIEVWTMPNIDLFWVERDLEPTRYTELLRVAYRMIKEQNPNTFVITAALAPTGAQSEFPNQIMNDDNFLREMVAAAALDYADCVGIRYVGGVVAPTQLTGDPRDNHYSRYYPSMVSTYQNITNGQLPLCFTEIGYLSGEGLPRIPVMFQWAKDNLLSQQVAWLDEALQMAAESGQVRILIIWSMNNAHKDLIGFNIIRPDGTCPACDALGDVEPPIVYPAVETCYAQVVSPDNFLTLRYGNLVYAPTRVRVNYNFRIVRPAQLHDSEYEVLIGSRTATIAMDDVELIGACTDATYPITAYPNDVETNLICEIVLVDDSIRVSESLAEITFMMPVAEPILVMGIQDSFLLQIQIGQLSGTISRTDYSMSGNCTENSFPMLVIPPQD